VERDYDQSLPPICARGSELNQVWTNLIDNAASAMHGKGELRIRTARENDRVLVEIRDNGPGIPPEIQTRIFEPFFTTKPVGEGTGLGLDMVRRIISTHHGDILVQSKPGDTRFQIRLPISKPRLEPRAE
jgi:signal transduction histidine kinase